MFANEYSQGHHQPIHTELRGYSLNQYRCLLELLQI
ncbi:MAG: hypothetical protein K0S24_4948 [Sphingobacterium sp.]|jgi:hypothetical protein|nr:hypothetical protein [Sphingobacterium sp.]